MKLLKKESKAKATAMGIIVIGIAIGKIGMIAMAMKK